MTRALPISLLALLLVLAGCGDSDEESTSSTTAAPSSAAADACEQVEEPPARNIKLDPPRGGSGDLPETAKVKTSCGDFEIALDTEGSPKTVASFAQMAEKGVYDDTTFHRIVPDFVIQGGDPRGDGTGDAGYTVEEAPPPDAAYTDGVVAMAKTGAEPPGTSGSQFFVVITPDSGLPPHYAILGEVSSGQGTIDAIAGLGDPESGQTGEPLRPVVIETVTVR